MSHIMLLYYHEEGFIFGLRSYLRTYKKGLRIEPDDRGTSESAIRLDGGYVYRGRR